MTVCCPQGTALIDQALAAEAHMVRPILVSSATKILVFFAFKEVFGETTMVLRFRRLSSWFRCFSGRFPCLKDDR